MTARVQIRYTLSQWGRRCRGVRPFWLRKLYLAGFFRTVKVGGFRRIVIPAFRAKSLSGMIAPSMRNATRGFSSGGASKFANQPSAEADGPPMIVHPKPHRVQRGRGKSARTSGGNS